MFRHTVRRGFVCATASLIVTAGTLSSLPAAHAAFGDTAPVIIGPTGTISTNSPTLAWNRLSGATSYEVQLDDSSGFTSPEWHQNTVNSRSIPNKLIKKGLQHWRVRARNATGTTTPWREAEFTISTAAAPVPLTPIDGQELPQPAEPPLLSWSPVAGATSYTVEVDTELEYVSPLSFTTRGSTLVVPVNQTAGTYVWHVKASKADGVETGYSASRSYTVLPIDTPQIAGPETNSQVEDVVLDWDPVPGAKWYELQVDDDADFGSVVQGVVPDKVFGTRFSPKTTFANDQYFWRVRAVDLSGEPTEWDSVDADTFFSFTRNWRDTPAPVHPAGVGVQHVFDDLYFEWTPVQHASNYELWVSTDENFTVSNPSTKVCHVAGTTYTAGDDSDVCMPPTEGVTYYWKVRPMDRPLSGAGVPGIFSAATAFTYRGASSLSGASPSGGETVAIPTFSWDELNSTEKYQIRVFNGQGTEIHFRETYSTTYTPMNLARFTAAQGPFTWSLTGFDVRGNRTLSYINSFNISDTLPGATGTPLTPLTGLASDAATVRFPNLTWQPVDGADHYRVHIGDKETNTWWGATEAPILQEKLYYPAATDVTTRFLGAGEYDWYVTAHLANGTPLVDPNTSPPASAARYATFKIAALGVPQGQRIALTGTALDADQACTETLDDGPEHVCTGVPSTPVLDWEPVPGASYYRVHISRDSDFSTGALDSTPPATVNTRWAPTMSYPLPALDDSDVNQAFHWFIQPCKSATQCGTDPISTIDPARSAFRKSSPELTLVTPAQDNPASLDDDITTTEVSFDWEDYFDTNLGTVYGPTGETSYQSATRYQIQVDNQANFASPIDDAIVDQSTYTAADRLYPEGPLFWRVQALDVAGNQLGWSTTRTVVKRSIQPTPVSPSGKVDSDTAFEWNAQAYTGKYEVQIDRNHDNLFNQFDEIHNSNQPAFTLGRDSAKLLAPTPSNLPYRWRVRRVDPYGNPGDWSAPLSFYVDGGKPALLSPAAGVWVNPNDALFTWSAVPGATQYRLEYKLTSATSPSVVTTPATSWGLQDLLPDGAYQWRVTALDVEGAELGSSEWRSFKVDGSRPTVVTTAPFMLGKRGSNFTVTFSEPVYGVSRTTFRLYRKGTTTAIGAVVTVSADRRKAVLNPSVYLVVGRTYVAKLSSSIKDAKGNTLVAKSYEVKIT